MNLVGVNMWKTEEHTFNKIIQTLGKSKQSLDEDARTIQKWMKSQTHLPEILGNYLSIKHNILLFFCRFKKY